MVNSSILDICVKNTLFTTIFILNKQNKHNKYLKNNNNIKEKKE